MQAPIGNYNPQTAHGAVITSSVHTATLPVHSGIARSLPSEMQPLVQQPLVQQPLVQPGSSTLQLTPSTHPQTPLGNGAFGTNPFATAVPLRYLPMIGQPTQAVVANGVNGQQLQQVGHVNVDNAVRPVIAVPPPAVEASFRVLEMARREQVSRRPEHLPHFLVAHAHHPHNHDPSNPDGLCCGQRVVHHGMFPTTQTIGGLVCQPAYPVVHAGHNRLPGSMLETGTALSNQSAVIGSAPSALQSSSAPTMSASRVANEIVGTDSSDDGHLTYPSASPSHHQPTQASTVHEGAVDLPEANPAEAVDNDEDIEIDVEGDDYEDSADEGSSDEEDMTSEQARLFQESLNQVWFTRRPDKDQLQGQGVKWKSGSWSPAEKETLEENIQAYLKLHKQSSLKDVLCQRKKERKDFFRKIAEGIKRPLFSVYRCVMRMYGRGTKSGRYSEAEVNKLKELESKYGRDWVKIGKIMGRTASSVKDRFRLIKKPCSNGRWTEEEEKLLLHAVHEATDTPVGETVEKQIIWSEVAVGVPTRSEKQCRAKWQNSLSWLEQKGAQWMPEDELTLIKKIEGLGVEDEVSIDWASLAKDWPSVRSPQWLHSRWWSMKRIVPKPLLFTHKGTVEYMKKAYPGVLERKAKKRSSSSASHRKASVEAESDEPAVRRESVSSLAGSDVTDKDA